MIVIDTSVAVKWAVNEPGHAEALALLDLNEPRYAPDLLVAELTHVLRKKKLRGEIAKEQASAAIDGVLATINRFIPSADVASVALAISDSLNHSAYDCFFLAVAFGKGVLVTADEVFARKAVESGYGDFVFPLGQKLATLLAKTALLDMPSKIAVDELKKLSEIVQATVDSLQKIARG